ncbi:MAG: type II secretion system F family protein [Candidatus Methanomethylicia archaeon]
MAKTSLVGLIYGLFPWSSKIVMKVFRNLDRDLRSAGMNIYKEAYASVVGFIIVISLIISLLGIPLLLTKMLQPELLTILEYIPYSTFILIFSLPLITLIIGGLIPKIKAASRSSALETETPFLAAYISVMATGGISPYSSLQRVKNIPLLKELSKVSKRMDVEVRAMGMDPISAIEKMAYNVPSKDYRELLLGYTSTLRSGGDVVHYLMRKTELMFQERLSKLKIVGERMGGMLEVYIAIAILLGLGFYTIYIVSMALGGFAQVPLFTGGSFFMFAWIIMPMISFAFIYLIDVMQPKYPESEWTSYYIFFISLPIMVVLFIGMSVSYMAPEIASFIPILLPLKEFCRYLTIDVLKLESGFEAGVGAIIALTIGTLPAAIIEQVKIRKLKGVESGIVLFLRDLVEVRKTGMSPEHCIMDLSSRDYGRFSKYLKVISNQVGWGTPFKKVYETFHRKVKGWLSRIIMFLLIDAIEVGGGAPETLESLTRFGEMIIALEKEKKMILRPLLLVPYIGAMTFIISTIVLLSFMRTSLAIAHRSIAFAQFATIMLPPLIIHTYITGLVAGKISGERVANGFKHALILLLTSIITIIISPLLSVSLQFG